MSKGRRFVCGGWGGFPLNAPISELEAYGRIIAPLAAFYNKLLFIPPKQCVYQKKAGSTVSYQAISLEAVKARIKNTYPEGSREVLVNCQSEAFKKAVEPDKPGRFIAEVGGVSSMEFAGIPGMKAMEMCCA